jgi:SAM-dependent methyltransferase
VNASSYVGSELDVFAHAQNWKRYYGAALKPYLRGVVAEVGAGIGATSAALCDGMQDLWICLEPDAGLLARARREFALPSCCRFVSGTSSALAPSGSADAILYIDTLEHIEDDRGELLRAMQVLAPGGHLLIVAPAHPYLSNPFDAAVGHLRRYQKASLLALVPDGFEVIRLCYLDSAGFFVSLANRLLLRQAHALHAQIQFWDRALVPLSRVVDPLLGYRFGKSVLGIFRRACVSIGS